MLFGRHFDWDSLAASAWTIIEFALNSWGDFFLLEFAGIKHGKNSYSQINTETKLKFLAIKTTWALEKSWEMIHFEISSDSRQKSLKRPNTWPWWWWKNGKKIEKGGNEGLGSVVQKADASSAFGELFYCPTRWRGSMSRSRTNLL